MTPKISIKSRAVLSLCDRSGVMVQPWAEAEYLCWCVDIQHPDGATLRENDNVCRKSEVGA